MTGWWSRPNVLTGLPTPSQSESTRADAYEFCFRRFFDLAAPHMKNPRTSVHPYFWLRPCISTSVSPVHPCVLVLCLMAHVRVCIGPLRSISASVHRTRRRNGSVICERRQICTPTSRKTQETTRNSQLDTTTTELIRLTASNIVTHRTAQNETL